MNFINDIMNFFLPEIALICFILIQVILSFFKNIKFYKSAKWITLFGILFAILLLSEVQIEPMTFAFSDAVVADSFVLFFKFLILISSFLIILLTKKTITSRCNKAFQFQAIFLTAILSSLILISANDFLTMLVALEGLSISSFFLISFKKGYKSKEATFKYLITNSIASSVFLFGTSYLYGITGSLNFINIHEFFVQNQPDLLYIIASILISCGVLFKLAIAPFSNWVLDVYEGSSTAIATFLSIVPKVAMFGILSRLLVFVLCDSFELTLVLTLLAVSTAIWANTLAVRQRNIKRLLGCSSSANAAYMLFALSLVSVYNVSTVLFYIIAYIFMNIGVFAGVIILENSDFANKDYHFKYCAYAKPFFTLCFAICVISLAGIPITSGFFAKLYLFSAIIHSGLIFLPFLIIMGFAILVSLYYYTNIIKLMFDKPISPEHIETKEISMKPSSATIILYICTAITVLLGVFPSKIIEFCQLLAYNI